jgi:hypothetical protein
LARAKNTSRAEARKRTREAQRAELLADEDEALDQEPSATPAAPAQRRALFRMPDVRADIRALPTILRTRRLIWLPAVLLLAGFAIILVVPALPATIASIADLYLQFFFIPPALFTFFIAGYVAPRASYLVGLLYGLFASVLWSIVILGPGQSLAPAGTTPDGTAVTPTDPVIVVGNLLLIGALYGTLAGAFAAWYRDFLRGMRDRGVQQRAEREAKERAKRREERQEARRVLKQRT